MDSGSEALGSNPSPAFPPRIFLLVGSTLGYSLLSFIKQDKYSFQPHVVIVQTTGNEGHESALCENDTDGCALRVLTMTVIVPQHILHSSSRMWRLSLGFRRLYWPPRLNQSMNENLHNKLHVILVSTDSCSQCMWC